LRLGADRIETKMPRAIQTLGLDRPGLPNLPADQLDIVGRLIEPLGAPFDVTGIGWVVHNLHVCLTQFCDASGIPPKGEFARMLERSESANTWISKPSVPPKVAVDHELTLWNCFMALARDDAAPTLRRSLGAAFFLVYGGFAPVSQTVLNALFQASLTTREDNEALNSARSTAAAIVSADSYAKALAALKGSPASRTSAASSMVEAKVEKSLAGGYRFNDNSKLELHQATRGLTAEDVIETANEVRTGAEAGSGRLLLAALAHWHGVLPADFAGMQIFDSSPGLMRMDPTCSYTKIRLSGILIELARRELPGVVIAGDTLFLPIPRWISVVLRALRLVAPQALSMSDLPGIPTDPTVLRRLLAGTALPGRITANKFVVDRALPLVGMADPIVLSLAAVDWTRVDKVANAYQHIEHEEFLRILALRALRLGWGELAPAPVPTHGYLSKATPELEAIVKIGQRMHAELDAAYPGPNAGVNRLLAHHDAFIHYTAFLLAVGLVLRGQERTLIPASCVLLAAMAGFNDKLLPSAKARPADLVFGPTLRHQFRYLAAHYKALAKRLRERATDRHAWIEKAADEFEKVADGAVDRALLVRVVGGAVEVFTHLDLVAYLGDDWAGKADALRHKAPDILRAAGVDYANREATLRHVVGARPITSVTSAWSGNDWHEEASRHQELLFGAFGIAARGGLIKSLPRKP